MLFKGEPDGIENYDIKGIIGRGGSSQVYIADCKRGRLRGRRVAIKIIPSSALPTSTHVSHHISSTALHLKLHHPSILSLLSVFQTANEYFHVLELCSSGTLASYLMNRPSRCLSESEVRCLLRALIDGLSYLARERVVHRDLKADNILLTEDYRVKLADFGLATKLEAPRFEASTFCGTPNYLSPEVIAHQPYGPASDLWALGCLTITILTGKPPFQGETVDATLSHASAAQYMLPQTLSQEARDLIGNLLQINPDRRIPLHKILFHPFFNSGLPSTPLAPPSFYPSPSPLILSHNGAVWTNKENISPKRGILSKNAKGARHHKGPDFDNLLDLRRTIDRPILGEHILNAPVMDPNIRRTPSAARIPLISQVSFISTSSKPPPRPPLHSSDRFSVGSGVHRIPRRSTSTDLKGLSGYKSIPVPTRKSPANYRSHLISPPSTAVSHTSKPALKGKYSRPYDGSITNSALTTNSLTPSASASQIPSRQASPQYHSNNSDIPNLPIHDSQQPAHTRRRQHSNKSNNPVSASVEHDAREPMPTSHISDLTVPSTVRKLVSPSRHVYSNRLPIDFSRRPRSPQNKYSSNDQASGVPVRLETSCLPPRTYATPHGHITVLQDSCDLVVDLRESERRSGRSGTEVLKISSDGRMVEVFDAPSLRAPCVLAHPISSWAFEDLPSAYWKRYRFAARFVDLVKSRTPKFIMFTPQAKCTLMSNAPTPDIELLFPSSSTLRKGLGPASSGPAPEPTMRIRFSKRHNTIEISRFTPFVMQSSVSPHNTRLPNVTEVTKGEWSKKVVSIPKDGSLAGLGITMGAAERHGLAHLDECRGVCEKLLETITSTVTLPSSTSSQRGKRGTSSSTKMQVWESFVDERETEGTIADLPREGLTPCVLHKDAWTVLLHPEPTPARLDSFSLRSRALPVDLSRKVHERISPRPPHLRYSGMTLNQPRGESTSNSPLQGMHRPPLSLEDPHQSEHSPKSSRRSSTILNATLKRLSSSTLEPTKDAGPSKAYLTSPRISPLSRVPVATQLGAEAHACTTETRFLPALGWCIKTSEAGIPPKYKVMFLDGASLEVDDSLQEVVLIDRTGKRTESLRAGPTMAKKVKERLAVFDEFLGLFARPVQSV